MPRKKGSFHLMDAEALRRILNDNVTGKSPQIVIAVVEGPNTITGPYKSAFTVDLGAGFHWVILEAEFTTSKAIIEYFEQILKKLMRKPGIPKLKLPILKGRG